MNDVYLRENIVRFDHPFLDVPADDDLKSNVLMGLVFRLLPKPDGSCNGDLLSTSIY